MTASTILQIPGGPGHRSISDHLAVGMLATAEVIDEPAFWPTSPQSPKNYYGEAASGFADKSKSVTIVAGDVAKFSYILPAIRKRIGEFTSREKNWANTYRITAVSQPIDKAAVEHIDPQSWIADKFESVTDADANADDIIAHPWKNLIVFENKINTFKQRSLGWDGDDGVAPNDATVAEATAFLEFLAKRNALPHVVFSTGDGDISFEWRARKRITEVGFRGFGVVSWFHRDSEREICRDEKFSPVDVTKNEDLLEILGVEVR